MKKQKNKKTKNLFLSWFWLGVFPLVVGILSFKVRGHWIFMYGFTGVGAFFTYQGIKLWVLSIIETSKDPYEKHTFEGLGEGEDKSTFDPSDNRHYFSGYMNQDPNDNRLRFGRENDLPKSFNYQEGQSKKGSWNNKKKTTKVSENEWRKNQEFYNKNRR